MGDCPRIDQCARDAEEYSRDREEDGEFRGAMLARVENVVDDVKEIKDVFSKANEAQWEAIREVTKAVSAVEAARQESSGRFRVLLETMKETVTQDIKNQDRLWDERFKSLNKDTTNKIRMKGYAQVLTVLISLTMLVMSSYFFVFRAAF